MFLVRLQVRHHAQLLHLALHARERSAVVVLHAHHRLEGLEFPVLAVAFAAHGDVAVSGGAQHSTVTLDSPVFEQKECEEDGGRAGGGWKRRREKVLSGGKKKQKNNKGTNEYIPTIRTS